jgi:HEAT repeat protein
MAVEALGMLQMREALPVLEKILDEELEDVYLIHEVLKALAKIPDPRSRELLRRATGHRYRLVREKAKELLEKSEK